MSREKNKPGASETQGRLFLSVEWGTDCIEHREDTDGTEGITKTDTARHKGLHKQDRDGKRDRGLLGWAGGSDRVVLGDAKPHLGMCFWSRGLLLQSHYYSWWQVLQLSARTVLHTTCAIPQT